MRTENVRRALYNMPFMYLSVRSFCQTILRSTGGGEDLRWLKGFLFKKKRSLQQKERFRGLILGGSIKGWKGVNKSK